MALRSLFGLSLVLRAGFHIIVAVYAAMDLNDIHSATSGTLKQLALKFTHLNNFVMEVELPLIFYVICGVALLILVFLYPWRSLNRSRFSTYCALHLVYIALVVYFVYYHTIIDLSYLRDVYQVMSYPWLFPASLALDVLTFIAACTTFEKTRSLDYEYDRSPNSFPLIRQEA